MAPHGQDWSTRHSVSAVARRTAALVNALTVDEPRADDVADVLRDHGESDPIELTAADVARMREAAVTLRQIFAAADVDAAAACLNRILPTTAGAVRLSSHRGLTPWHLHLDRDDDAPWGEWFLASSCLALAVLIWDRQRPPGGVCAARGCGAVYLTEGSGLPRRYCSRRCATRERVAAYRARA